MNDVKKVSDAEIGMNVTRLRENADLSLDDVVRKMKTASRNDSVRCYLRHWRT